MLDLERRISALPIRRLATEDGVLAWREAGQGTPMLLLHGISSGSASWLQQLETWSSQFRVIAWDVPGYGAASALGTAAPRAADYAAALARLVRHFGAGPSHVVGHSLGALIAAAYAARCPAAVRSLTLLNPALGYGAEAKHVQSEKLSGRIEQMQTLGPEGIAVQRIPLLVSRRASARSIELLQWNARRLSMAGYAAAATMLASGNLLEDIRSVTSPVLVVTGSEDRITPPASAESVVTACRAARLTFLPDVGHASYVEDPDGVAAALLPFALACEQTPAGTTA